jgi:hypothetical protein
MKKEKENIKSESMWKQIIRHKYIKSSTYFHWIMNPNKNTNIMSLYIGKQSYEHVL